MIYKIREITTENGDGYFFIKRYVDTPKGLLLLTILSDKIEIVKIKEKIVKNKIIGEIEIL